MQWYYAEGGQRNGPISQEEFDQLVTKGKITSSTLVWHEGMPQWRPYAEVGGGQPATDAGDTAVCVVSGKTYPKREMIQYEGRWISAEHRDEYFQRIQEGAPLIGTQAVPGPYGYGGFGSRFAAVLLDSLILMSLTVLIAFVVGGIFGATGLLKRNDTSGMLLMQVVIQAVNLAITLTYQVYFIRKNDATPGKMAVGLKILRSDGSKLSAARIIGRYFAQTLSGLTLFIGYLMVLFDDQKRSLHDRICDTRVIKSK